MTTLVTPFALAPGDRRADCAHCGLPVPAGRVDATREQQFCCDGCSTVYAVLSEQRLADYYRYRDRDGARPAQPSGKSYAELDDPSVQASACRALADGSLAAELYVEGVHCAACVWLIERLPLVVPGALGATLDIGRSLVEVVFDPSQTRLSEIGRTLDSFGYPPHVRHGASDAEQRRRHDRALLVKIGVAGASAGNAMLLAFALYGGLFSGIEAEHAALLRWASLIVALPAVLFSGMAFFRGAWAALRTRVPHVDLPLAIGIGAGFLHGAYATVSGQGEIYFDSITMLIFLLLVGRYIERRQTRTAREAAAKLHALAPSSARKLEGERVVDVPLDALAAGDRVEVRAGEQIPADGVVTSGTSTLDSSLLSGESRPDEIGPGDEVHAGCINLAARIVVRVDKTGAATRVGQLLASVEEAAKRRAPIVRLADRVAGAFVVTVLVLAALTFGLWQWLAPEHALHHTIALLVVTCPCALGMATPLAVSVALGRAARQGILVKGGDALEALARPALFVFDKTGTLTEGRLELIAWEGTSALMPAVAAAEACSAHPIASALCRALPAQELPEVAELEQTLGGGVSAIVDSQKLVIGSESFVRARSECVPAWAEQAIARHAALGRTPVLIARGGRVEALAVLADPLRPDARASLDRLRALGHRIAILSGDHPLAVAAVAAELGELTEARGAVSPEDKLAFVEREVRNGPVVMVGDGVNDAGALSAATVGVAVHGGAEASLAAARVFMTRAGVSPVVELALGARRTLSVIRRGIGFSLVYNLIGAGLAIGGLLSPLVAAVLMPISSLSVVSNAYRSRSFRP